MDYKDAIKNRITRQNCPLRLVLKPDTIGINEVNRDCRRWFKNKSLRFLCDLCAELTFNKLTSLKTAGYLVTASKYKLPVSVLGWNRMLQNHSATRQVHLKENKPSRG